MIRANHRALRRCRRKSLRPAMHPTDTVRADSPIATALTISFDTRTLARRRCDGEAETRQRGQAIRMSAPAAMHVLAFRGQDNG